MVPVPVRLSVDGAVATITIDRPDRRNALDAGAKAGLLAALRAAAADGAVRALVLTGAGPAFCAGQDLAEHARNLAELPLERVWATVLDDYAAVVEALADMPKPTLAAVNGVAAGAGAALALACDLRLLADDGGFDLGFARIGLSCDTGTSWSLPRIVGLGRAAELLLLPRTVGAAEAVRIGLATEAVRAAELGDRAGELAARLAAGPTVAYVAIRRALAFGTSHPLPEALRHEADLMWQTGRTADHRNAVAAFLAHEQPTFDGR